MRSNTNEPEHHGLEAHGERNPEVTFESADMSARAVVGFLIALAIAGALIVTMLWGVFRYLAKGQEAPPPKTAPISASQQQLKAIGGDPAQRFPTPRLQSDPAGDLKNFRVHEDEVLNSYGWVDEASGKVHIPIERAMQLLSQTGLPTRPEQAPPGPSVAARGAAGGVNISRTESSPTPADEQRSK